MVLNLAWFLKDQLIDTIYGEQTIRQRFFDQEITLGKPSDFLKSENYVTYFKIYVIFFCLLVPILPPERFTLIRNADGFLDGP